MSCISITPEYFVVNIVYNYVDVCIRLSYAIDGADNYGLVSIGSGGGVR